MAERFSQLSPELSAWVEQQHLFFVASAAPEGYINLSPKGQDSLRILSATELLWLNLTGSGNETAAHLRESNRITMMWCAFAGPPRILRVYGNARTIHASDPEWQACAAILPPPLGARQYFRVAIELVQTSCGYAVPMMDFREERAALTLWAEKKGAAGIEAYWEEKNTRSLDGKPTGMPD